MQEAVDDDAAQLLVEGGAVELGVCPDGVEADVDVAAQRVAAAVVETDVVGVVVVADEAAVDVEHRLVVDEDVVDVAHHLAIALGHLPDPSRDLRLSDVGHRHILCVVGYHGACSSSTAFLTTSSSA